MFALSHISPTRMYNFFFGDAYHYLQKPHINIRQAFFLCDAAAASSLVG